MYPLSALQMAGKGISPLLLPEAKKFYAEELTSCWSDMSMEEMRATDAGYGSVAGLDTLKVGTISNFLHLTST